MGKSGLKDSASVAETAETGRKTSKGLVVESKTFRDGLIYLYKRSDYKKPTWLCRIKVPNGNGYVTRSTGTGDEHQAFKFADDLYHQLLVKSLTGETIVGTRIGPAIDAYVLQLEPDKKRLSILYKIQLMGRVKPFLARKVFEDLSTAMLSDLIDHLSKNTKSGRMSPNTVKRTFSNLKHFFNWCVDRGHLVKQPQFPKVNGDQARRPQFDAASWQRLINYMAEHLTDSIPSVRRDRLLLGLYVHVLAETGIRVGEARNLRWRDLRAITGADESAPVNIALTVRGKTGIREVVASRPKVRDMFNHILRHRKKDLEDPKSDIHELKSVPLDSFIFCDRTGKAIGSFKKSFKTLTEAAGVAFDTHGERRTIYSLRHTYATSRLEAGVNHYVLAKNMGTSVTMLERFYGHTSNVGMVDELTKPKGKARKSEHEAPGAGLDWLGA